MWKLDRLVRRPAEFERFWSVCEARRAVLASATEPLDTSYELGLALVRILVTFAHLESATIGLRSKAKHRELAEAGRTNGPPPYGWQPGMRELEPAESAWLREALQRALAGETIHTIIMGYALEYLFIEPIQTFGFTFAEKVFRRRYHRRRILAQRYDQVVEAQMLGFYQSDSYRQRQWPAAHTRTQLGRSVHI